MSYTFPPLWTPKQDGKPVSADKAHLYWRASDAATVSESLGLANTAVNALSATLSGVLSGTLGATISSSLSGTLVQGTTGSFLSLTGSVRASGSVTLRSLSDRFADVVNVKDFGAAGDGVTDDTTAIQSALGAGQSTSRVVFVPSGTYLVSTLSASRSLDMTGFGVLKQLSGSAADLLTLSGTGSVYRIVGITFDGNYSQQDPTGTNKSILFSAIGAATGSAGLALSECTFQSGNWADVSAKTDDTPITHEWLDIRSCKFMGGREGTTQNDDPRYVDVRSPQNFVIDGNVFDRLSSASAFGRAGVVIYDGFSTIFESARGVVSNNAFNLVGRSQAASTLGCIDFYDRARSVSIIGNSLFNPVGRGIQTKSDALGVSIVGNTVDGLLSGSDGTLASQIVLNAATIAVASGALVIANNTLLRSNNDAISVTGRDNTSTAFFNGIVIVGNVIDRPVRRGVGVISAESVSLIGNSIVGGAVGVFVDGAPNPSASLVISDNVFLSQSGNAVQLSSSCSGTNLSFQGNTVRSPTSRGLVIGAAASAQVQGNAFFNLGSSAVSASNIRGALVISQNTGDPTTPWTDGGSNPSASIRDNYFTTPISFTGHKLTINGGVITASMDWHHVAAESGTADDLVTIAGGWDGANLMIRPANAGETITAKDTTGNLRLFGDFAMNDVQDTLSLKYSGGQWLEVARSDTSGTLSGTIGTFGTITGTSATGTTSLFQSSTIQFLTGTSSSGTLKQATTGSFLVLTGTTVTGTTSIHATVTGTTITGTTLFVNSATFGSSTGTTVTYNTGAFTVLTGTTTSGTAALFGSLRLTGALSSSYSQDTTVTGSITLNAPTGRFVIATGTTSFVLTNSALTAQSILYVNIETSSSAYPIKSITPTLGTGTIALVSSSVNLTASFIVFNGA